jgi:hypothetical protein
MYWQAGVGIQLAALLATIQLAGRSGDPIGGLPASINKRQGMAMYWQAGVRDQLAALQRRYFGRLK